MQYIANVSDKDGLRYVDFRVVQTENATIGLSGDTDTADLLRDMKLKVAELKGKTIDSSRAEEPMRNIEF